MSFASRIGRSSADDTPPNTPTITSPAAATTYGTVGSVTYSGTVSDASPDSGIVNVQYQIDGNPTWVNITGFTPGTGTVNWSFTGNGLTAGQHTFVFRAENGAGLYSSPTATRTFWFDNSTPTVAITTPTAGFMVSSSSLSLAGTAADTQSGVALVQYKVGSGGSWTSCTGTTSWTATATIPLGDVTIYVRSVDNAGNLSAESTVSGTYGVAIPSGVIVMFNGAVPSGWTPNAPDFRDRYPVGAGLNYGVGSTGGTTSNAIANHTHDIGPHQHYTSGTSSVPDAYNTDMATSGSQATAAGSHTHAAANYSASAASAMSSTAAGGVTLENRPLSYAVNFAAKV